MLDFFLVVVFVLNLMKRLHMYYGARLLRDLKIIGLDSIEIRSSTVFQLSFVISGWPGDTKAAITYNTGSMVLQILQLENFSCTTAVPDRTTVANMWLHNTCVHSSQCFF